MNKLFQRILAALSASVMVACGGGSPDGSTPDTAAQIQTPTTPTSPSNRSPAASAGPSQSVTSGTAVTLDASGSTDPDGDSLSYAWSLSVPSGSTASLSSATAVRPTFTPDVSGTYTAALTVSDARGGTATITVTVTAQAQNPPAIALGAAEPLSESVKLSVTGTVSGSVTWYVDLRLLGNGNAADSHSITWNTAGASNGSHQILAQIQGSTGTTDLRRTVTVSNSTVTLSASASGTTGTIHVDARAASSFGITSVSAQFDGADVGTLTQPNACSRFCSGGSDIYRFTVNGASAGSGAHTMVITASDGAGGTRSVTVNVPISNAPTLTLTSPPDGAVLSGSLNVAGSTSTDKTGGVTVTAKLGDVSFLSATSTNFATSYNLNGLTPGTYVLTVRSTDATGQATQIQRNVIVAANAGLAYTPVFTLPTNGQILAVESSRILYSAGDGSYAVRDLVSGAQVSLAGTATLQYATDWQISSGRVYAQAKDSDCTPTFNCVYEWSAAGTRRNLSQLSPYTTGSSYQENPVARDGYVVWTNWNGPNRGSYTLYDASAQSFRQITQPAEVNYIGNTDYGLSVSNGLVQFAYWGQTAGDGTTSQFDTYLWRSDTGASTRITAGGSRNIYPMIDSDRMAWQQSPVGGSTDGTFTLQARSLSAGATSTLSAKANRFQLRDGVLAWVETPFTGSTALKVSTGGFTQTPPSSTNATLLANVSGWVAFSANNKTYTWNSATGLTTLRLDASPGQTFISAGAMIFTVGTSVYRIALD